MKAIKANIATIEYIDKRIIYSILVTVAVVSLLILSRNIYSGFQYHTDILNYKKKITRLQQNLEVIKHRNDEIKSRLQDKEQEKIQENAVFLNRLITQDIFPWDQLLDTLEKSLPEDMVLNSIVPLDDFQKITIDGYAEAMKNIAHLLKMLNNSIMLHKSSLVQLGVDESNVKNIQEKKTPEIHFVIETFSKNASLFLTNGRD